MQLCVLGLDRRITMLKGLDRISGHYGLTD